MPGAVRRPIVVALLVASAVSGSGPAVAAPAADVVVRDQHGTVLIRVAVRDGSRVTLRYRNSVYGSAAEERFVVAVPALRLVEVAADERAVLDEYYVIDGPAERTAPGDARAWRATPRDQLTIEGLAVAATDLGRRALVIPGQAAIPLWPLVDDPEPTVLIALEPTG